LTGPREVVTLILCWLPPPSALTRIWVRIGNELRRIGTCQVQSVYFVLRVLKYTRWYPTLSLFLEEPYFLLVRPHRSYVIRVDETWRECVYLSRRNYVFISGTFFVASGWFDGNWHFLGTSPDPSGRKNSMI
jgi:hypothetical protein